MPVSEQAVNHSFKTTAFTKWCSMNSILASDSQYTRSLLIFSAFKQQNILGHDSSLHTQNVLEETVWNLNNAECSATFYSMLCDMLPTKK